jgi:hypothetical protein
MRAWGGVFGLEVRHLGLCLLSVMGSVDLFKIVVIVF